MAPPFHQLTSEIVEVRGGGGCLALFGIPVLLAGGLVGAVGFGVLPVQSAADAPEWTPALFVAIAAFLVLVGSALVFGRRRVRMDVGLGRVVERWTMIVQLRRRERDLGSFAAVGLREVVVDNNTVRYPVELRAVDGALDLGLYDGSSYEDARGSASHLASFLRLPLLEGSTDHESLVAPEAVETCLGERLRAEGGGPMIPQRPPSLKSEVKTSGGSLEILIPAPGPRITTVLGVAIPVVMLALVLPHLIAFFADSGAPPGLQIALIALVTFLVGVIPISSGLGKLMEELRGWTRITVSAEALTIESRGGGGTDVIPIPVGDILDVDFRTGASVEAASRRGAERKAVQAGARVPQGHRVVALAARAEARRRPSALQLKTRAGLVTFGAGLPDEEAEYLHAVIVQALVGAARFTEGAAGLP